MSKKYKNKTVYEAAIERYDFVYSHFNKIYVSFSGGKDSGLMLNMAIEAAKKHNKLPVHVLIVDLEAQYRHTADYLMRMVSRPEVKAYWVCLPIHLRNAVNLHLDFTLTTKKMCTEEAEALTDLIPKSS